MHAETLYGGIEAGGTKFICIVGSDPGRIVEERRIQTTTPSETLQLVEEFFRPYVGTGRIRTLGVGSFGPLELDPTSPDFGCITSTPKPGWQNTNITARLSASLGLTLALDTDVNAAALGEFTWGAGQGADPFLYLTIGTGIGGGFIQNGKPLRGMSHPEMGHVSLPHDRAADPFPGSCPFHKDCFEGLASGPAIGQRFSQPAEVLTDDNPFWEIEAGYIAAALANYVLTLSPSRIILGGGVMKRRLLLPAVCRRLLDSLHGYVRCTALLERVSDYVVPPLLGSNSGVFGALALARQAELGHYSATIPRMA